MTHPRLAVEDGAASVVEARAGNVDLTGGVLAAAGPGLVGSAGSVGDVTVSDGGRCCHDHGQDGEDGVDELHVGY